MSKEARVERRERELLMESEQYKRMEGGQRRGKPAYDPRCTTVQNKLSTPSLNVA